MRGVALHCMALPLPLRRTAESVHEHELPGRAGADLYHVAFLSSWVGCGSAPVSCAEKRKDERRQLSVREGFGTLPIFGPPLIHFGAP